MELLTVEDVAKELDISEGRVRQICQAGELGQKLGRQWIITRAELDDYKERRRPPGRPRESAPDT